MSESYFNSIASPMAEFGRSASPSRDTERSRRIAMLEDQYNSLEAHWSVKRNSRLDPRDSDHIYKYHVMKLKEIYTSHKSKFLQDMEDHSKNYLQGSKNKVSTQLYGFQGLKVASPHRKEWEQRRESSWDNEVRTDGIREKYRVTGTAIRGQRATSPHFGKRQASWDNFGSQTAGLAGAGAAYGRQRPTSAAVTNRERLAASHNFNTTAATTVAGTGASQHLHNKNDTRTMPYTYPSISAAGADHPLSATMNSRRRTTQTDTDYSRTQSQTFHGNNMSSSGGGHPRSPGTGNGAGIGVGGAGVGSLTEEDTGMRYRCLGEMSEEDRIMLGLYQLNEEQSEIYSKFVSMLSQFDSFDMKKITHDAMNDAKSVVSLHSYGGTEMSMGGPQRK